MERWNRIGCGVGEPRVPIDGGVGVSLQAAADKPWHTINITSHHPTPRTSRPFAVLGDDASVHREMTTSRCLGMRGSGGASSTPAISWRDGTIRPPLRPPPPGPHSRGRPCTSRGAVAARGGRRSSSSGSSKVTRESAVGTRRATSSPPASPPPRGDPEVAARANHGPGVLQPLNSFATSGDVCGTARELERETGPTAAVFVCTRDPGHQEQQHQQQQHKVQQRSKVRSRATRGQSKRQKDAE
ncbi:unnamed protein product [Lampetra planeri]